MCSFPPASKRPSARPGALLLLFTISQALLAQQGGFLEGTVKDAWGAAIAGAQVTVQEQSTGWRQRLETGSAGHYETLELSPGRYKLTVRIDGFRSANAYDLAIGPGQTIQASFALHLLPKNEEITVESTPDNSDPTAAGVAVARHSSSAQLPENGRDLHSLYALIPGAILTPAAATDGGQFSVTGQRPTANTFRVDGLSGNTGVAVSAVPGASSGSTLPAMTVIGSTQALASKDEIERVEMRSTDFAPEYGDRPGGQILIETRSGSDAFHGDFFGYIRPQAIDSQDWLAQRYNAPLRPASLNGYGGSLGGPIWRDRTFFFAALERSDVHDSALEMMPVPSLAERQTPSPDNLLLNAFPLPLPNHPGLAGVPFGKDAALRNASARLDQELSSSIKLFARYADAPSHATTQQLGNSSAAIKSKSASLGATAQWDKWIHDLRFSYSDTRLQSSWGALNDSQYQTLRSISNTIVPLGNDSLSVIAGTNLNAVLNNYNDYPAISPNGVAALSVAGLGQILLGVGVPARQVAAQGRYTLQRQFAKHDFRAGLEASVIHPPAASFGIPATSVVAPSLNALLDGDPLGVTYSFARSAYGNLNIGIGSAFLQDTYRINPHLTLLYGLRWEITGNTLSVFTTDLWYGSWAGPSAPFVPASGAGNTVAETNAGIGPNTWPMRFNQIAPRFGFAYSLRPNLVLRAGGGLFYDTALASLINPVNLTPLNTWQYLPGMLSGPETLAPPAGIPSLQLPQVWEWRAALERSLGGKAAFSLAYVGASGKYLPREKAQMQFDSPILQYLVFASDGSSQYNALQAQLRDNLTSRLYALVSYSWSHSIDTASQDGAVFETGPGFGPATDRGSSNFDVRHNLNASLSWTPRILKGTVLGLTAEARTGFPFDVTTLDRSIGLAFANSGRPDLVSGVPLWIDNTALSGGRELNPAAFRVPSGAIGTLGRNVLTGPGLFQLDATLRHDFHFGERTKLELNLSAFNLFNRTNFANPVGYLGSPLFGQPASMQNLMLGSGAPNAGLTPLFQSGGPRTIEVGLKITF